MWISEKLKHIKPRKIYNTEEDAIAVANALSEKNIFVHTYKCAKCEQWHTGCVSKQKEIKNDN